MKNGKLMDFFFSLFRVAAYFYVSAVLRMDGVLNYVWKVEIVVGDGGLEFCYLKCKKRMSLFIAAFCEQLPRRTLNLMSCEH